MLDEIGSRSDGDTEFHPGSGTDAVPWMAEGWEDDRWRDHAACRSTSAELFFPAGRNSDTMAAIKAAKSVCRSCEARPACLAYALETNQDAGVWGGTSEDERRKLRRAWLSWRRHAGTVMA
ncbi:MAG TPA: WhiB family transcriptional regulator [Acidimicrobiales bacterium]|jgi:WhiB family redox-sensing transcriptional regulator|nr:WhiB family transcriptional regulator [Acidimicrobiales bacterium]